MNSTKETWDDILKQCRTWIQELTVAKFWYPTFNNSALQRRSQGRILPQSGFFYRENTCPVKHCTALETCICPDWFLEEKKTLCKSHDQKRLILIKAKYNIRPVIPHLSAHCCHFYLEQLKVIQGTPLLQTILRTSEHTHLYTSL